MTFLTQIIHFNVLARNMFSRCSWPALLQMLILLGVGSLFQMWFIHFCFSHEEHQKWKPEPNFWYRNPFIDHISLHMVLPGHKGLIISEECLFENFVDGLKLTWCNGSIVGSLGISSHIFQDWLLLTNTGIKINLWRLLQYMISILACSWGLRY